jgi:D-alanyl-D-alanine carboxypeptidase/D-alanyl-D-alanine-endopeptidase (penicillin-binding protein 4)
LGQFNEKEETFIYAKSGSMSGVYNLAGYLKTSSGRILAFAVMNNNFTKSVSSVRAEVAQFLLKVRADY